MLEGIPIEIHPQVKDTDNINSPDDPFQWKKPKPREVLIGKIRELKKQLSDKLAKKKPLTETDDRLISKEETKSEETIESEPELDNRTLEQKTIDEKLIMAMDNYRNFKKEAAKSEAVQEISERSFNKSLTKLENIKITSQIDDTQVSKREIDFNGKSLTVYDLKGFPFSFLQHAIDYKGRGENHRINIGSKTAKSLQDNPSLWTRKKHEISEFGGEKSDSQSNTISVSYVNLEKNAQTLYSNRLFYGFDHVEPDSILRIGTIDMCTPGDTGDAKTSLTNLSVYLPETLEDNTIIINEILIRRYKENNDPKLPDYLITEDGNISEIIKKHAEYFNIPIINIETKYYKEKESLKLMDAINNINENSNYKDIKSTLDRLNSSFLLPLKTPQYSTGKNTPLESSNTIGDGISKEFGEKLRLFLKLEFTKRMEFIKKTLQEEIIALNLATSLDKYYFSEKVVSIKKLNYGENYLSNDTMHCLNIKIRTEIGSKPIESSIYDGDNPIPGGSKWEGDNSQYYNELAPIVEHYLLVLRKNEDHKMM